MKITTNAPQLAATFRRYAAITRHRTSPEELLLKQARQLVIGSKGHDGLIQLTKAAAPTRSEITADVKKQGWKIPTFFADGSWGRGYPKHWTEHRLRKQAKRRGAGRVTTKEQARIDAIRAAQRPSLAVMQRAVSAFRASHRFYVTSGWLKAARALGGSPDSISDHEGGRVVVGRSSIAIINDSPGIIAVNRKHHIARRAIAARILDMRDYIRDHLSPSGMKASGLKR